MAKRTFISTRIDEPRAKYILKHYKGTTCEQMATELMEHFGGIHTKGQVQSFYLRNDIHSGLNGKFKKGHISSNKGMKQEDYMSAEALERTKATRFKVGGKPINHHPVGHISERVDYLYIKIAEPDVYIPLHQKVWIDHYGSIPEGGKIIHLDGDVKNNDIDNLYLTNYAEMGIINKEYKLTTDVEINKAILRMARIRIAIKRRKDELSKRI